MFNNPKAYKKAWVAVAGVLGVVIFCLAPTETEKAFEVTMNEWYFILVASASALGVERVRNTNG